MLFSCSRHNIFSRLLTLLVSVPLPTYTAKCLLLVISAALFSAVQADVIIYPGVDGDGYYPSHLLRHVLSYTPEKNYQAKPFGVDIPKGRNFELLANNDGIDVVFGGSTIERESKYQPIRFPILRGLNGWRIPLVRNGNKDLFLHTPTLEQFKRLKPGQFHSWSDTKVLTENGIEVVKGADFDGLFGMLAKERFDYFPRSVLEIENDLASHQGFNLIIEANVLIHYPTAYYFYVRKGHTELAKDLEKGLEASLQDGSLDKLFMQYYGQQVNKVKNSKRRVIQLSNPLLPKETPLDRKELWIDLSQ